MQPTHEYRILSSQDLYGIVETANKMLYEIVQIFEQSDGTFKAIIKARKPMDK